MSAAANPADPTPLEVNAKGGAAVIDLKKRRRRPAAKGRWQMNGTEPSVVAGPGHPLRDLAESYETTFNEHDLSLTNSATATAYRVTLKIVAKILEGAEVQGLVDGEQRQRLGELVEFADAVPELLA